jgi:sulfatase modifying factor 1
MSSTAPRPHFDHARRSASVPWRVLSVACAVLLGAFIASACGSDESRTTTAVASASSGSGSAGAGGAGTTCGNRTNNCGPGANEDCCASPVLPSGTYHRSYDGIVYLSTNDPATISSFALDRFEVTVGRFRAFVAAGKGTQASPPATGEGAHPHVANSGWDASWSASLAESTAALDAALSCSLATWTEAPGSNETLPINCATWFEAFAFCAWDGGRLPTEAEWNYAAAGGDEQRHYPWSAAYPPGSTTIDAAHAVYGCLGDGVSGCSVADILGVGSRSPEGDGRFGHADLAGNVWEWTLDLRDSSYINPCEDCANLTVGTDRVARGGDFDSAASYLRVGYRSHSPPGERSGLVGVRCARGAP